MQGPEPDSEEMFWVLLDGHESTLLATVRDGHCVFATFAYSLDDETTIMDNLNAVMLRAGYSAGDESDVADCLHSLTLWSIPHLGRMPHSRGGHAHEAQGKRSPFTGVAYFLLWV